MSPSLAFAREASRTTLHFMSDKELSRLEILRDLGSGRLRLASAAKQPGSRLRFQEGDHVFEIIHEIVSADGPAGTA